MFKAIIIDDERPALLELHYILSQDKRVEIVDIYQNPHDGFEAIKREKPDVVFLDIQMPGMTGLELAEKVMECCPNVEIVFTTAYDDYAIEAFNKAAIDYVMKPYDEERISKTINRLEEHIEQHRLNDENNEDIHRIPAWYNGSIHLIEIDDVCFFTVEQGTTVMVTNKMRYEISLTLSKLEDMLAQKDFKRTHRAFLVNLAKVTEIIPWFNNTYVLKTDTLDDEIQVSRKQVKEIKEYFKL